MRADHLSDATPARVLLPEHPLRSLEAYREVGGSRGLETALRLDADEIIELVRESGLRGRGGAGFPTGTKWQSVRSDACPTKYVVCNGAEGEPGTFKDRLLIRSNPYAVIEGIEIAALAIGARKAYIGVKASFRHEIDALERALAEMSEAGLLTVPLDVVFGPDEYLYGEETGLLEVIEGSLPLPRGELRPYQVGLFAGVDSMNPTLVNNVETLANVPSIIAEGPEGFRRFGTERSPGTMIFTVSGDVREPGVYELPLGMPMRALVEGAGGGAPAGRAVKAVFPGASAAPLTAAELDLPLEFDAMRDAGSGLGSGGFVVYDDRTCMVAATLVYSRFLSIESCGQCPPCKLGTTEITSLLERIDAGRGTERDLDAAFSRRTNVTDGRRCALPVGEADILDGVLPRFFDEFRAHLGRRCPNPRDLRVPKFVDYERGRGFEYDERYRYKRLDWSYADRDAG